jgi:hypothetical protein
MFSPSHRFTLPAFLSAALALGACSALVDTKTEQCQNDEDCKTLAGGGSTSTCDPNRHVCVGRVEGGMDQPTGPKCARHQDCGEGGYCLPGANRTCKTLLTPECTEVFPTNALSQDNVVLVGLMAALTDNREYGLPHKIGAQVALDDIGRYGGLPALSAGGQPRRLAALICDQKMDAARHLVGLRVPAIIGASTSGVTIDVLGDVTQPAGVLLFSPAATSPALNRPDEGLFWRTVPADDQQMNAMRLIYAQVEKAVRATIPEGGSPGPTEPLRLLMLNKDDAAGTSLRAAALAQPLGSPAPIITPIEYEGGDANTPPASPADWEVIVGKLLAAKPHIVMPLGTTEFVELALRRIEMLWQVSPTNPRPWYVMPEGNKTELISKLAGELPLNGLGQRVIGTAPGARRGAGWQSFASTYQIFTKTTEEPGNLSEFAYDAVFMLGYAIGFASGADATANPMGASASVLTGAKLRDGLSKMTCKGMGTSRLPAGGGDFSTWFTRAAAPNNCLDFDGASGPVDFDENGETKNNFALWCATSEATPRLVSISTYYNYDFDNGPGKSRGALVDDTNLPTMLDLSKPGWCKPRG